VHKFKEMEDEVKRQSTSVW